MRRSNSASISTTKSDNVTTAAPRGGYYALTALHAIAVRFKCYAGILLGRHQLVNVAVSNISFFFFSFHLSSSPQPPPSPRHLCKTDTTTLHPSPAQYPAACSTNATCNAWTWHDKGMKHGLQCSVAPEPTFTKGTGRISGSKVPWNPPSPSPPPPSPAPPPPPPPPLPPPHPPLGKQPNIVLVLQDDMDLYMGGGLR